MKFKRSLLSFLMLSIPFLAHSELTITDENNNVITDQNQHNSGDGEQDQDSSVMLFNKDNSGHISSNEIKNNDSGDGDSSDLSPEEIQSIEDSGGTVVTKSVAKNPTITRGYGNKVTSGVPDYYSYKSIDDSLSSAINSTQKNPSSIDGGNYPILKKGSQGTKVSILSLELVKKGYLNLNGQPTPTIYDEDIVNSVKLAQSSLGLKEDGIAGPQFLKALGVNLSSDSNASQGLINWKNKIDSLIAKAKESGQSKIIIVNIPSYTLKAIDVNTGEVVIESKVVVGKPNNQTPMNDMDIIGLKYNPNWTPPMSVIKRDVLNNVSNSNSYIRNHNLKAIDSNGNSYSLSSVSKSDILSGRYRVQQAPGTNNSLGVFKFETNSPENIYLHDTNQRYLFNNTTRSYSLGCIRVQQWFPLAQFISEQNGDVIKSNLDKGKTYIQRINKVPVYITYSLYDVVKGNPTKYKDIYNKGGSVL